MPSAEEAPAPLPPPPGPLVVTLPPFVAGTSVDIEITGGQSWELAHLGYGLQGLGAGPCLTAPGQNCLGLTAPRLLGTWWTDVDGVASVPVQVPANTTGQEVCFQAAILRGPNNQWSDLSVPVCGTVVDEACLATDGVVSFDALGTFDTEILVTDRVTVTGSGDVRLLNVNGLGVVGGVSDRRIDGAEWVSFVFPTAVDQLDLFVQMGSNLDGDGLVGERFMAAFAPDGSLLGEVSDDGIGAVNVSSAFADAQIGALLIAADVDDFRLRSVTTRTDTLPHRSGRSPSTSTPDPPRRRAPSGVPACS